MDVILISNRKGGVGKTTTSVNLATALSMMGKKILLIDLDTQSHIQFALGYKKPFQRGIHRAMMEGDLKESIYETDIKNLHLAPADINFEISKFDSNSDKLKKILNRKSIKRRYDIVIIDTSPTLDNLMLNALVVSNYAIVPMQVEYLGYVGMIQFLRLFYKTISNVNSSIKLLGIVPTMYNKSMKEHQELLKELEKTVGKNRVFDPVRKDSKANESFKKGVPAVHYAPRARISKDYKQLAFCVVEKISN